MSDLIDLIDVLQRKQLIWQGRECTTPSEVRPSGYDQLDDQLAGGFPKRGVVSINSPTGIGELRFLLNALQAQSRLLVFIQPPGILCAEFFHHQGIDIRNVLVIQPRKKQEALWAAEQCLKSGACSAVLLWQNAFEVHQIKRFQLASEEGDCLQFLMRSNVRNGMSLPVSLSMSLEAHQQGLDICVHKRKGGWSIPKFRLDMSHVWPVFSVQDANHNNVIPFPGRQQMM